LVAAVLLSSGAAAGARGQTVRAPEAGGRTMSLGQPLRWHWQMGLGAGAFLGGTSNDLLIRAWGGGYRASMNPVTKLVEFGLEGYVGARGNKPDAGTRALLQIPYLSTGVGPDYNIRSGRLDLLLTVHTPVRRGGFLTRGTMLRFDWYPTLGHSFVLGVSAPLHDPLAGRNRPIQDYVVVAAPFPIPQTHESTNGALRAELDSMAESATLVRRLVVPFLDQDGRNAQVALARTQRYLASLRTHLAVRSAEAEARFFHAQMEHAFGVAAGSAAAGRELARNGRQILLAEVLIPYDALLGRKKRNDTLKTLGVVARGRFSRWVTSSGLVPAGQTEDVLFVFERLTDILEEQRSEAAKEWDDPRLVWLPLQYGLLPEDHDEQAELDALLERVTGAQFTERNRLTYVANLQFHWELLRMIRETRAYHVLWVHDFPALTSKGALDEASLAQVVDGYLTALAERVEAYDSTGTLPVFFIFHDEHYYEGRKSRLLMTILEDPLQANGHLGSPSDGARLGRALDRLRDAVRHSRVLQAEAREYGDAWLRNRIKVQVNITNRVDASFWSGGLVSSVFGYPDDVMRDHRKIAFRDASEDDPFAGGGILTGMGVGEQYLGPGWDDRSLQLQGPVLLQLKQAARELLVSQGIAAADIPAPLRAAPLAAILARVAAPPDAVLFHTRAIALVNETGYLAKSLNSAKALLYSLMPPGSVIKVPDSLWNATFYGSLLVGAALRGATVLIIAPALANAPSGGFPQMARAHELFSRLLLVRRELAAPIASAGGALHAGLYALPADQHGFASRADRWARQVSGTPFLQKLYPFAPSLLALVADAGQPADARAPLDSSHAPKLHQKVQFLATGEFWRAVTASPHWQRLMATYLRYRAATYTRGETEHPDARALTDSLEHIAEQILASIQNDQKAASFALVGSQNQDYRGMFMDGEVAVLFTGATSLVPLVDLVFMVGTVTWVEDDATLDRLLPPVGELQRRISRVTKDGV
jgi:phosphatidylserine/phosphatidylglycerophosphate/cardiolipin synthase-like enzyme